MISFKDSQRHAFRHVQYSSIQVEILQLAKSIPYFPPEVFSGQCNIREANSLPYILQHNCNYYSLNARGWHQKTLYLILAELFRLIQYLRVRLEAYPFGTYSKGRLLASQANVRPARKAARI